MSGKGRAKWHYTLTLAILIMGLTASATLAANTGETTKAKWQRLSQLNEPANKPSTLAAKAATQHLTKGQIRERKKFYLRLLKRTSAHANGTALQILRREIHLLTLAEAE